MQISSSGGVNPANMSQSGVSSVQQSPQTDALKTNSQSQKSENAQVQQIQEQTVKNAIAETTGLGGELDIMA